MGGGGDTGIEADRHAEVQLRPKGAIASKHRAAIDDRGILLHMKEFYVYMVRCSDRRYYTGITNNVERRIGEHNEGIDPTSYTHRRRPVVLVYVTSFSNALDAIAWEKRIKGWSRKKKEALISENWEQLAFYSKRKDVILRGSASRSTSG